TYFIPVVVGLALIAGILIGIFMTPALAIQCAASLLVEACPCILGLVIPVALKFGQRKSRMHDCLFRSARALQAAESIDAVVFDMNGTLTTDMPVFSKMLVAEDAPMTAQTLLSYVNAIEKNSDNAIARAICKYAQT